MAVTGIMTVIGRKKLCKAHAGEIALPSITHMGWGNGGVDENGQPKAATGNETSLYSQLLQKVIESRIFTNTDQTTCCYSATVGADELVGEEISEIGLFDSEGDLVAYRTFSRKGKDADIPQSYEMSEIF